MLTIAQRRAFSAIALAGSLVVGGVLPASAQAPAPHKNFIQRHPTATGVAAGIATHHELKVMAARDKREGKHLNWAERHPTLSGIGVGVVTHHEIVKHTAQ
jgi:hypothetical protein